MTMGAFVLPSSRSGSLLRHVFVTRAGEPITDRPLPYGTRLPDGADVELNGLGYARVDDWTEAADGWRCTVQPHA
ncbi:hypothetical protein [Jiangella alkaliphila]|uniref:Uncharacterized protein n=1 Tax=Jiangella alkaliphila TaxID=419479 RepID=A0A1H2H1K8_9ACTN|nr:hypothetical protein [Jiangella alkaliphila]SDU25711.1 hypothetical protein SAMN04488563_0791 [Jiangella alkaliphila]